MKKNIVFLLTIVMLFCFAACSNETNLEEIRGEQSVGEGSSDREEKEFSLGTVDGLSYKSEFIGIGCKLDRGWSFYSEEKIKELNNIAIDMLPEDFAEAVKNVTVIYDMYAVGSNQLDNININLEKIDKQALAALDIAENYEEAFPTLKQAFENMGYTDVTYEISSIEIGDETFPSMYTCVQMNGVKVFQKVFSIKCNGYLANITVTTYNEDATASLINKFYILQ